MTNGSLDTGVAGTNHRPRLAPIVASTENGTRNLTEAATHSQYRARAWSDLSVKASNTATAANPVDCHRWLAARRPKEAVNSGVGIASSLCASSQSEPSPHGPPRASQSIPFSVPVSALAGSELR